MFDLMVALQKTSGGREYPNQIPYRSAGRADALMSQTQSGTPPARWGDGSAVTRQLQSGCSLRLWRGHNMTRDPSFRSGRSAPRRQGGRTTMMKADSHDWQPPKCVRSSVRARAGREMGADIRPEDQGPDCKPSVHFRQLAIFFLSFLWYTIAQGQRFDHFICRRNKDRSETLQESSSVFYQLTDVKLDVVQSGRFHWATPLAPGCTCRRTTSLDCNHGPKWK